MCRKPVGDGAKRVTTSAPVASVELAVFSVATTISFTHLDPLGSRIGAAPSMATKPLQTPIGGYGRASPRRLADALETRLDAERERVGLWLPVALGAGIAAWFALPAAMHWAGLLMLL